MSAVLALAVVAADSARAAVAGKNDETVGEKISEAGRDAKKNLKKGARAVKDKTCEWVNGKMECAAKKLKHKAQNASDEVKDKVDDIR